MGLIAYIPRKNERQTFPALDPARGGIAFAKPSQAQRVVLRDVRQSKPVYVTAVRAHRRAPDADVRGSVDADPPFFVLSRYSLIERELGALVVH